MLDRDHLVLIRVDPDSQASVELRHDECRKVDPPRAPRKYPLRLRDEPALSNSLLSEDQRMAAPPEIPDKLV